MKIIFRYMKKYTGWILLAVTLKLLSTVFELFIPYVLEHIIDTIVRCAQHGFGLLTGDGGTKNDCIRLLGVFLGKRASLGATECQ